MLTPSFYWHHLPPLPPPPPLLPSFLYFQSPPLLIAALATATAAPSAAEIWRWFNSFNSRKKQNKTKTAHTHKHNETWFDNLIVIIFWLLPRPAPRPSSFLYFSRSYWSLGCHGYLDIICTWRWCVHITFYNFIFSGQ